MDEENKKKWLNRAEVMDAHRVVPKLIVLVVMIMYAWFAIDAYVWVKELVATSNNLPASISAFVGGTLSALGAVLMLVINKYFDGGRKWTKKDDE
jgi:cellobiose-specific phosphotransferase system component IIC